MINLLIHGASGRMGKKVYENAVMQSDYNPVCGVSINEDFSNRDFPIYKSFCDVKEKVNLVIDFSSSKCIDSILDYCTSHCIPAVICSTGIDENGQKKILNASKKIAIFKSGNMSLGINVLLKAVKLATKLLEGFDVEIIEKHHNQKEDAPSGTALMIADAVKEIINDDIYVYGRQGIVGKRKKNEIGIHAVRGGNIVGEHDVIFAGRNEVVTLSHHAQDRSVFADGAIKAGRFIVDKPAGLYDMNDLLK